ncbi:hypothetical protein GCM10022631_26280 [Deinococcus rubellus]
MYAETSALNLMRSARDTGPRFLCWREAAGKRPATVHQKLVAVRLLYKALRWAEAIRLLTPRPLTTARPPGASASPTALHFGVALEPEAVAQASIPAAQKEWA